MRRITGIILGGVALAAVAGLSPVSAQNASDKLMMEIKEKVKDADAAKTIHDRRMAMRNMSGNMKVIVGYAKEGKGSPQDVAAAAGRVAEIAKKVPDLIVKGTSMAEYEGATGLKPDAFQDSDKLKGFAMSLSEGAEKMVAVASASGADRQAVGAAIGAMGSNCGGCHKAFRQKLN